jgi:prepilin-type N-terminal cleavage/methylation domain-containing protein
MRDRRRERGFTMLELAIVTTVIGILAGIAIPNYARSKARVNRSSCWSNQRHLYAEITLYVAEYGLPDGVINSQDLFDDGVIASGLADCPENRDGSHDDYDITIEGGRVTAIDCLYATEDHHWDP